MKTNEKRLSYAHYLKENKLLTFFYFFTFILNNVVNFIAVIEIANGIGKVVDGLYDTGMFELILGFCLLIAGKILFSGNCILTYALRYRIRLKIKNNIANRIFDFTSSTYSAMQSGKFVQRIKGDVETWFTNIDAFITNISFFLYSLAFLIYMCFINVWVGVIIVSATIVILVLGIIRDKVEKRTFDKTRIVGESNTSLITEMVKGEKDIKSLSLGQTVRSELIDNTRDYEKAQRSYGISFNIFRTSIELVGVIATFITLVVSAILFHDAVLTTAMFMYIITNRDALVGVAVQFHQLGNNWTLSRVSASRINELFDESKFPLEKFGTKHLDSCSGVVEFKNVTFAYKDYDLTENDKKQDKNQEKIENKRILDDISFKIEPNKTTAIVGRSGSGKTTIISLIPKMYEADSGQVLLDGVDIKELDEQSIRGNIALVNQFPYIFDTTIRKNLQLVKQGATDDEIWEVLKKASLYDFVYNLPNKLDTKVGEGGIKLSGGQRQRLSIARALLKQSQIIIFDESTSSLDNFAQFDIQKSIEALSGERTIIVVAHRLSTIKNVDTILFVGAGKLIATGTFNELFENNEDFRSMFEVETI